MWHFTLIFRYHLKIAFLPKAVLIVFGHWQSDCSTTTFQTYADGESSCDFTTCEAASTATAVEAFAESNEVLLLNILVHLLWICLLIIYSSVRCGYPPSQKCSRKCWPMDLQSSMILKMLESLIFPNIFIYRYSTTYSSHLCSPMHIIHWLALNLHWWLHWQKWGFLGF